MNLPSDKKNSFGLISVEIEINHKCNRTCAYCPNSITERKNQGHMSEALFVRIMQELRAIHYQGRISYHFYNEPLLSADLERFVFLTRDYLPKAWIEIYTNGTLLTKERLMGLFELGVNKFTVTKHHGSKDYPFDKVFQELDEPVKRKIKYLGYKDLHLTSRGGLLNVGFVKQRPPLNLPCLIPASLMVITVTGNILPCFEDYHEKLVMGNLNEQSLAEIWNSARYIQFRQDLKQRKRADHEVCKDCNCALIVV